METLSYCQLMERCLAAEARVVELESRTVKLPPRVNGSNFPFTAHTWNCCIDEVESCLTAAGIKWEVE